MHRREDEFLRPAALRFTSDFKGKFSRVEFVIEKAGGGARSHLVRFWWAYYRGRNQPYPCARTRARFHATLGGPIPLSDAIMETTSSILFSLPREARARPSPSAVNQHTAGLSRARAAAVLGTIMVIY